MRRATLFAAGVGLALTACAGPEPRPAPPVAEVQIPPEERSADAETSGDASVLGLVELGDPPQGPLEVVREALARRPSDEEGNSEKEGRVFDGLQEKWRARIGATHPTSTIHVREGRVIVNSNGADPSSPTDRSDAVWILAGKDGSLLERLQPPGKGDRDCNGLAVSDRGLTFGTDQGFVYAYDWESTLLWKAKVDGPVKAMPALADLDGDGVDDVVAGTTQGTVYALRGRDGKVLWKHRTGRNGTDGVGIWGGAALYDASKDGVPDVFVPAADHFFRAFDGATGRLMWEVEGGSPMWASPLLLDVDADGRREVAFSESDGVVYLVEAAGGGVRWRSQVNAKLIGGLGWSGRDQCVLAGTSPGGKPGEVLCVGAQSGATRRFKIDKSKAIAAGFVVGDVDGAPGDETVVGTGSGALLVLGPGGKQVWRQEIGTPITCPPTLADVDGDGRTDILVAGFDGYLRAFDSAGVPPSTIGYYRVSPDNRGAL